MRRPFRDYSALTGADFNRCGLVQIGVWVGQAFAAQLEVAANVFADLPGPVGPLVRAEILRREALS